VFFDQFFAKTVKSEIFLVVKSAKNSQNSQKRLRHPNEHTAISVIVKYTNKIKNGEK